MSTIKINIKTLRIYKFIVYALSEIIDNMNIKQNALTKLQIQRKNYEQRMKNKYFKRIENHGSRE